MATLGEIDGRAVEAGWWSLVLEQVDDGFFDEPPLSRGPVPVRAAGHTVRYDVGVGDGRAA
ncbi:hypothetical protein GCM10009827_087560 [Dactylosporangium maewongense]|uniref:Uncharacterized protein n=1 Tax=Dactylosporangium maewongense TaxID=634393 RepID=A0ABP4N3Y2_9ACTN